MTLKDLLKITTIVKSSLPITLPPVKYMTSWCGGAAGGVVVFSPFHEIVIFFFFFSFFFAYVFIFPPDDRNLRATRTPQHMSGSGDFLFTANVVLVYVSITMVCTEYGIPIKYSRRKPTSSTMGWERIESW